GVHRGADGRGPPARARRLNVRDALRDAERTLAAAAVPPPRADAELLLAHALGTTRRGLYSQLATEGGPGWEALREGPERRGAPADILELEPEVRHWEPRSALVGQGIAEQIAAAARYALRPEGWLVLETAADTTERLTERIELLGYGFVTVADDLSGMDRVV